MSSVPLRSTVIDRTRRLPARGVLLVLVLALGGLALVAVTVGALPIPLSRAASLALATLRSMPLDDADAQAAAVLWSLRLPRIVLAIAAGAGLAAAGATLQGIFRNPLADPMLIGVSSGAALAVTGVIVLGATVFAGFAHIAGPLTLPLAGFAGGLATTALLYRLSTHDGRTSLATMLLGGIALNALALSGIGLLTTLATNEQLRSISFWNFGSLAGADWPIVVTVAACVAIVCVILVRFAPALDALALGDREARHLGVETQALKRNAIVLAALLAGFVVAACGVIGFIALVAPHLVRLVCGPGHRTVLPGAALLGAVLLLAADLLSRVVIAPAELPIGIVTALLGAPFFLWLLIRRQRALS